MLLGLGGIVMLGFNTLLGGTMMAAGCALIVGFVPSAASFEGSSRPRPGLGLVAILTSLPLLAFGSPFIWGNLLLMAPGSGANIQTIPLIFGGALVLSGALLFRYGYIQAALPHAGTAARLAALGAAAVAVCWLPLTIGSFWASGAAQSQSAPSAKAAPVPPGLASADGAISLEMPDGWTSLTREGTVLFVYKDDSVVSISPSGPSRSLPELLASAEKSRQDLSARGAALQGEVSSRALAKGGSMVFYRFRQDGTSCSQIEFTAAGRSYSASARGLDADAEKALQDSLSKL